FGLGAFLLTMPANVRAAHLVGWEIHESSFDVAVREFMKRGYDTSHLYHADIVNASARDVGSSPDCSVLVIGNPPWVTSAEQGTLGGKNTGRKTNLKALKGMDALTGKSN